MELRQLNSEKMTTFSHFISFSDKDGNNYPLKKNLIVLEALIIQNNKFTSRFYKLFQQIAKLLAKHSVIEYFR